MKVTTADGKWFSLTAENEHDRRLIDAIDHENSIRPVRMMRGARSADGGFANEGAVLEVDSRSVHAQRAKVALETLTALDQIFRMSVRHALPNTSTTGEGEPS